MGPESVHRNKYILTLSDHFTKWVEAVPLPTKEARGVAKSLLMVHFADFILQVFKLMKYSFVFVGRYSCVWDFPAAGY